MARDLLDLHGFTTDAVEAAVDRFLYEAMNRNMARVRIMTGKGSGKIKNTVIQYLKRGRFPWQYERSASGRENEGVLIVFLD